MVGRGWESTLAIRFDAGLATGTRHDSIGVGSVFSLLLLLSVGQVWRDTLFLIRDALGRANLMLHPMIWMAQLTSTIYLLAVQLVMCVLMVSDLLLARCGGCHCRRVCPCDSVYPLRGLLLGLCLLLSQLTKSALANLCYICSRSFTALERLPVHCSYLVSCAFETSTILNLLLFSQSGRK